MYIRLVGRYSNLPASLPSPVIIITPKLHNIVVIMIPKGAMFRVRARSASDSMVDMAKRFKDGGEYGPTTNQSPVTGIWRPRNENGGLNVVENKEAVDSFRYPCACQMKPIQCVF
jgi:hypothetical protein